MANDREHRPEQIQIQSSEDPAPIENPLARGLNVTVSIPETVEIRMVDASVLTDYEVWFFIASLLSNAAIGFLVAYFQSEGGNSLWANTLIFGVLFLIALGMALTKRHKLRTKAKDVRLRATEVIPNTGDSP